MADYPEPLEGDPDSVVTALEVGASMWSRGEHAEAMKWLRKAVDEAFEAGLDDRGLELSKSAASLVSLVPPPPSAKPPATTTAVPPPVTTTAAPAPVMTAAAGSPSATTTSPPSATTTAPPSAIAVPQSAIATAVPPPVPVSSKPAPEPAATVAAEPEIERISPEPESIAPPPRTVTAKAPPPPPRAVPAKVPTSRSRVSRPPTLSRGIGVRPPLRASRGEDAQRVALKAPSALTSAHGEAKHDDISTRVTVPSDAPAKLSAAIDEAIEPKKETAPAHRDEVVDKPRFDRKFITPLAMPRTTTPPHPVSAPSGEKSASPRAAEEPREHASDAVLSEPPEGATRPAIPDDAHASHEHLVSHDRGRATREAWVTTGAVRVAVSREGSRVIVRPYDGGVLLDGEVEAVLVATPDAERLFKLLKVEGPPRT